MYIGEDYGGVAPSVDLAGRRAARRELADIIERALAELDALDGDPDAEPSLGAPETAPGHDWAWSGPQAFRGPRGGCQAHWAQGSCLDDAEDGGDMEPSLGATEVRPGTSSSDSGDQAMWGHSPADDLEVDAGDDGEDENEHGGDILDEPHDWDDNGIADSDGVWEQVEHRPREFTADIEALPEEYRLGAHGDCLAGLVPNGSVLICSRTAAVQPGDLVIVFMHRRAVKPGRCCQMAKVLLDPLPANPAGFLRLGMTNPPSELLVPMRYVRAVHRVMSHRHDGARA